MGARAQRRRGLPHEPEFRVTPLAFIDRLTYVSYTTNRDAAPDITPERWKKVYGPEVDSMEATYQAEQAISKASEK